MSYNRRKFIKSSVTSGAALLINPGPTTAAMQHQVKVPTGFKVKIMATNWGFDGSAMQFCGKVKEAGYDGIEVVWPADDNQRKLLFEGIKTHSLEFAFLVGVWDVYDYAAHLRTFETNLRAAVASKPLYINCHAGKDHFTFDQNQAFIALTQKVHQESGIPIYHETHRGRILYSAPVAKTYIEKIPDLRLTLDISHWCAVHESLLIDQLASVDLALRRTDHIHARVGHAEGPQVNDPRAPEWTTTVDTHLNWWDKVIEYKVNSGAAFITFLTEFGPIDYLPALPFTRQPVANQWDINVFMLKLLRNRYSNR